MATQVYLRTKPISKGRLSYYLDFWPPIPHPETGKLTRREFLNLYICEKAKTYAEKDINREMKELAENIRANRQLEISKGEFGFLSKTKAPKLDFLQYFDQLTEIKHRTKSQSHWSNWRSTGNKLRLSVGDRAVPMSEVNVKFCEDFKQFLLHHSKLKVNSASSYFINFCEAVKEAVLDGYISPNPLDRIKVIPQEETEREFLFLDELRQLKDTPCKLDELKAAMLFTALTGLRYSDAHRLTWSSIQHSNEMGHFIRFREAKKNTQYDTMSISEQAREMLGERGDATDRVFPTLPHRLDMWHNYIIRDWIRDAKIEKKITYHNFRHTYAILQLTEGTDIFTVSKMMGHKNLKTTQIYAKVVDEKKREAAEKIKI